MASLRDRVRVIRRARRSFFRLDNAPWNKSRFRNDWFQRVFAKL
jgi:hypothetical protein